jgi:hypothetical protein
MENGRQCIHSAAVGVRLGALSLWVTGKIGQRQMGSKSVAQGMPGHPQALSTYDR